MPIISDLSLQISVDDITRAWGTRRKKLATPFMLTRITEILASIDTGNWLQPAISYQVYNITEHGHDWLALEGCVKLRAPLLAHRLRRASHLVIGVYTIGDVVGQQVSNWFASRKRLQAVLLDEIGSLALFKLANHFESLMQQQARQMDLQTSGTLSPGDEGFALTVQKNIVQLAGGTDIGVYMKGGAMLAPQKSLTTVIGMGEQMRSWSRGENCNRCKARQHCSYRQSTCVGVAA